MPLELNLSVYIIAFNPVLYIVSLHYYLWFSYVPVDNQIPTIPISYDGQTLDDGIKDLVISPNSRPIYQCASVHTESAGTTEDVHIPATENTTTHRSRHDRYVKRVYLFVLILV